MQMLEVKSAMPNNERKSLIDIYLSRFGDLHRFTIDELNSMDINSLASFALQDSNESHR